MEEEKTVVDERTGMEYTKVGDYYLPNMVMPEQKKVYLNRWGEMRKKYLKEHRQGLYAELTMNCTLYAHLEEVQNRATEMERELTRQIAKEEQLDQNLKNTDTMKYVGLMNNIKHRAREIVMNEVIYV